MGVVGDPIFPHQFVRLDAPVARASSRVYLHILWVYVLWSRV